MGYTQYKSVADLAPPDSTFEDAAENAADSWAKWTLERARELTPVAEPPMGLSAQQFVGSRARAPGTAKRNWKIDRPDRVGRRVRAGVYGDDIVLLWLEYGTRPHIIRPRADRMRASVVATKRPRRMGHEPEAALRFYVNGRPTYARVVHHPGTRGQFIMHRAIEESVRPLREFLKDELRRGFAEHDRKLAA